MSQCVSVFADRPLIAAPLKSIVNAFIASNVGFIRAVPTATQGKCQAVLQPGMEAEPRSRRYGLFQGLRKRNKSESQASPHAFTSFSLWTAKPPSSLRPQSIAESDHDDNESNDVFASPRYGLYCVLM